MYTLHPFYFSRAVSPYSLHLRPSRLQGTELVGHSSAGERHLPCVEETKRESSRGGVVRSARQLSILLLTSKKAASESDHFLKCHEFVRTQGTSRAFRSTFYIPKERQLFRHAATGRGQASPLGARPPKPQQRRG